MAEQRSSSRRRTTGGARTFTETARREQITTLAIDLIATHGYAGASLARIAAAANISNAAVLYHFGSKNAVLQSAYDAVIEGVTESVFAAISSAPSARAAIDGYVRALVEYLTTHPTHMRLLVEALMTDELGEAGDPPPSQGAANPPPRWKPLADLMVRAQNDGELRSFDTRTAAIALGGALDAILAESLNDRDYPLDAAVDDLLELFGRATEPKGA